MKWSPRKGYVFVKSVVWAAASGPKTGHVGEIEADGDDEDQLQRGDRVIIHSAAPFFEIDKEAEIHAVEKKFVMASAAGPAAKKASAAA